MDFSYHPRTFRTVVRILLSSTFLTRVSNVAIKLVGLRREHMARLLKRTNAKDNHDDQAAAADDDDADDGAVPTTMTTTQSPKRRWRRRRRRRRHRLRRQRQRRCSTNIYNNTIIIYVAVSICRRFGFLILFLTPFSFVAIEFLRRYEKSEDGTKSPWYESSVVRKVHKWYETSMVRKVWFPVTALPDAEMQRKLLKR